MASGAIYESFPGFNAKVRSRVADENREPGHRRFLKNNISHEPDCQEIVDFY
jgi:hypothetical protein